MMYFKVAHSRSKPLSTLPVRMEVWNFDEHYLDVVIEVILQYTRVLPLTYNFLFTKSLNHKEFFYMYDFEPKSIYNFSNTKNTTQLNLCLHSGTLLVFLICPNVAKIYWAGLVLQRV